MHTFVLLLFFLGNYNADAIKTKVMNGKGFMPSFGERLGRDGVDDVAVYVYDQAEKWSDLKPRAVNVEAWSCGPDA